MVYSPLGFSFLSIYLQYLDSHNIGGGRAKGENLE